MSPMWWSIVGLAAILTLTTGLDRVRQEMIAEWRRDIARRAMRATIPLIKAAQQAHKQGDPERFRHAVGRIPALCDLTLRSILNAEWIDGGNQRDDVVVEIAAEMLLLTESLRAPGSSGWTSRRPEKADATRQGNQGAARVQDQA